MPRVDPTPDPARDLAGAVLERRLRDLCSDPAKVFYYGVPGARQAAIPVADVLAILDGPDPLGLPAGPDDPETRGGEP